MPRTVTVTFGDGSSHIYNGVPDDAKPQDVISRAQKEFSGRDIVNIDGGKAASAQPTPPPSAPGVLTFDPATKERAQGILENITGPKEGTQQDWFAKQQQIETALRAQGRTDEQIAADPQWQDAARNLSRSVGSAATQTAIGETVGAPVVGAAERGAANVIKPAVGMVRDAIGHESVALSEAMKKEAQTGAAELIRDRQTPIAARNALEEATAGRPTAKVLEVQQPTPLDTASVTQARNATRDINRQLVEANTKLQTAQRNVASLDKYAGQRRSEALVRSARRDLNKAQEEVNRLSLRRDEAVEAQRDIEAKHQGAIKAQKAGQRQQATSEKQISQAAKTAEGQIRNLKDLTARLNAAKAPSDIAAAARQVGKQLSSAGRLPPNYYERINNVVEKAKSTAEARRQLVILLRGALIGAGFGAGTGAIYEMRRAF